MSDPNQGFQPPLSDSNQGFQPPPPPPPQAKIEEKGPRPLKLRVPAIVLAVLGVLVLGGGLIKILPGGVSTGLLFVFWGALLFGLSFIRLPSTVGAEAPLSGMEKLMGIFYEPTRVFRNLRVHPHWLAAVLVIGTATAIYTEAFVQRLTAERIVEHTMISLENSPIKPPPQQMEKVRESNLQAAKQPVQRIQTVAKAFLGTFVFAAFVAALCLLGTLAFGGRINFWQAFVAVLYSWLPVVLISKVISLVILYIKAPEDIHPILNQDNLLQDNLGILFTPTEHPALFMLGTAIGVLSFYGLWLRAKGLQHAGTKVSSSAAWGVSITLWVLALIFGMIFATLFSSFMA